jgi:hypothetical protein
MSVDVRVRRTEAARIFAHQAAIHGHRGSRPVFPLSPSRPEALCAKYTWQANVEGFDKVQAGAKNRKELKRFEQRRLAF